MKVLVNIYDAQGDGTSAKRMQAVLEGMALTGGAGEGGFTGVAEGSAIGDGKQATHTDSDVTSSNIGRKTQTHKEAERVAGAKSSVAGKGREGKPADRAVEEEAINAMLKFLLALMVIYFIYAY
ncbi:hypothetical protein HDV00_008379 [Rhizophlyctis rosea]|nr:hypothetical protein HDV00_008379 [Rhizophlyctis rosea]